MVMEKQIPAIAAWNHFTAHEILGFAFLIKGTDVASAQRFLLECGSDACSYSSHFVTLRLLPFEAKLWAVIFFFLINLIAVKLTHHLFQVLLAKSISN